MLSPIVPVPQGSADRGEKSLAIERLAKTICNASGPALMRQLMTAGDQKNRQIRARAECVVSKREPVDAGKADIRNENVNVGKTLGEEWIRRRVAARLITGRLKQVFKRFDQSRIVIHDSDNRTLFSHDRSPPVRRERVI